MKLVIIPSTGTVGKDGYFFEGLDLSAAPADVHAVQWYEDHGEVEKKDLLSGKMTENVEISSISDWQFAIDAWQSAYDAMIAAQIAQDEAEQSSPEA